MRANTCGFKTDYYKIKFMEGIDPKDYCSLKPYFPKVAYVVYLFYGDGKRTMLMPLYQIHIEMNAVNESIKEVIENFNQKDSVMKIPEQAIIVPLSFDSEIPLERKYWEGEHENYSYHERTHLFLEMLDKPDFHQLFVVPTSYSKDSGSFQLEGALPIKTTSNSMSKVELFLQNSDYVVDERASAAALYNVGKPMRYDWETRKIDYPDTTRAKKERFRN
jgi:hypothetical protein